MVPVTRDTLKTNSFITQNNLVSRTSKGGLTSSFRKSVWKGGDI